MTQTTTTTHLLTLPHDSEATPDSRDIPDLPPFAGQPAVTPGLNVCFRLTSE